MLEWEESKQANPCVAKEHKAHFEYGGKKYELVPHPGGATFATCARLVQQVLNREKDCGAPQVLSQATLLSPSPSKQCDGL